MSDHSVYALYGLKIASRVGLPAPRRRTGTGADLELVYRGRSSKLLAARPRGRRALDIDPNGWELRYERRNGEWLSFRYVRAARQLVVTGTDRWADIVPILAGPAAGVLLRERGACVLHGSVVVQSGCAIALLGPSGAGKSSLAGALMARGARLATDDLVVTKRSRDRFAVQPGYCGFALESDTAALLPLSKPPSRLFPSRPDVTKLRIDPRALPGGFHATAVPLAAIYVLDPRDRARSMPESVALSMRGAAIALMEQVYGLNWIGEPSADLLQNCADIASRVPVKRLLRPDRLAAMAETADMLLQTVVAR
jgi:hypothetical protein